MHCVIDVEVTVNDVLDLLEVDVQVPEPVVLEPLLGRFLGPLRAGSDEADIVPLVLQAVDALQGVRLRVEALEEPRLMELDVLPEIPPRLLGLDAVALVLVPTVHGQGLDAEQVSEVAVRRIGEVAHHPVDVEANPHCASCRSRYSTQAAMTAAHWTSSVRRASGLAHSSNASPISSMRMWPHVP